MFKGGAGENMFRLADKNSILGKIYDKKIKMEEKTFLDDFSTVDSLIMPENKEKLAWFAHKEWTLTHVGKDKCKLSVAFEDRKLILSMIVSKNSEFEPLFKKYINGLRSEGVLDRIKKSYVEQFECERAASDFERLGWNKLGALFYLLLFSCMIGILTFILEIKYFEIYN